MSSVSESDLRRAVARFAAGVTIVAAVDSDGQPRGMTVSAFLFVSFDPPLIVVSVAAGVPTLDAVRRRRAFGVSVLGVDQQRLSDRFAGDEEGRFEHVQFEAGEQGPVTLHGAIGTLECVLEREIELGDHLLLVGRVEAATFREGRPLLYYRGKYGSFHSLSESHVPHWPAEEELTIADHAAYWH
ncbi:MAG: flavin reductase family protein [Chloroflexi bacterium]|nr:flavin reductase family protein [Chloroflexota bacterium]